ncbi:helix-turn-helix domain-containing protein [Leptospira kirschneri]|uniref:DNA-binding helix-turn-helix protein n=1 Tax=Leptospira kirschneri serovar Bulgarica str. Nikolaevo TaxID=1240687 RepID=M6FPB5_9LEPT|nr:helix-turn-helix transcriptional regulator [Leptospira kirschneri]EMK22414.1 DNA-binding helix-turn-helix protein [Leptospira kirschneri serovar Bulgarica str. Nikolaevo]EMK24556.1 DNA-binding helix-turn-helix protein [Leptospira kirschneri serovar Bulgarica str. Nikolaevo]EMK24847.1 DNA-binding helix-turn-helix protein [Leptospira kirschneri serovar Bulgarica str. Nikolaevo]
MSESDKKKLLLAKRFSEFFKAVGKTQEEFANRIGVSRSNISSWMNAVHGISGTALKAMEHEFDLNIRWYLTGSGEKFLDKNEGSNWSELEAEWEFSNRIHHNPKLKKLIEILFEVEEVDYSVIEELLRRFQKRKS